MGQCEHPKDKCEWCLAPEHHGKLCMWWGRGPGLQFILIKSLVCFVFYPHCANQRRKSKIPHYIIYNLIKISCLWFKQTYLYIPKTSEAKPLKKYCINKKAAIFLNSSVIALNNLLMDAQNAPNFSGCVQRILVFRQRENTNCFSSKQVFKKIVYMYIGINTYMYIWNYSMYCSQPEKQYHIEKCKFSNNPITLKQSLLRCWCIFSSKMSAFDFLFLIMY